MASDAVAVLRLLLTGDSAGAVAAIKEVDAATQVSAAKTISAEDAQFAAQKKNVTAGRAGMALMAGGIGLVAAAVYETGKQYKTFAEAVVTTERVTNLGAEGASRLVGEWQTMGLNVESMGRIVARFSKNYETAIDPTTKSTNAAVAAFKALGLAPDQLKKLGADQTLELVRSKLSGMADHAERAKVELALFSGRSMSPELMRWLDASNAGLAKIDAQLKSAGLIWNEDQVKQAEQFGGELRAVEEEFKAVGVSIFQTLVPAFSDLLKVGLPVMGAFNHLPGIFKDILVFAPGVAMFAIGLNKFAGALQASWKNGVETVKFIKQLIGAEKVEKIVTTEATVATEAQTTATVAGTGAMKAGIVTMGLYAAVLAGIVADIYLLVKAYQAWQSAEAAIQQEMQQAKGESATANTAQAKIDAWKTAHPGQALPADYQALQQSVTTAQTEAQGNVGRQVLKNAPSKLLLGSGYKALLGLAEGIDTVVNTPTPFVAGEGAYPERLTVTPLKGGRGSASDRQVVLQMHFAGANFNGAPDAATARRWAGPIGDALMGKVRGHLTGQNA
jgi:hypothetical protein